MASIGGKSIFAGLKFPFGLEPVVEFATRRSTPRQIDFLGALADLLRGRREFWGGNGSSSLKLPDVFLLSCLHIVDSLICCLLWGRSAIICTCTDRACVRRFGLRRENKTAGSGLSLSRSIPDRADLLCHIAPKTNDSATKRTSRAFTFSSFP